MVLAASHYSSNRRDGAVEGANRREASSDMVVFDDYGVTSTQPMISLMGGVG